MKILKLFAVVLIVFCSLETQAQADSLSVFLKRFDTFKDTPYAQLRWTNSPDVPANANMSVPMPNPVDVSRTHVEDPKSGLRHYPHVGKVYDPKSGYFIDYDAHRYYAYRVDVKSGKIYKGKAEVVVKRKKADESEGSVK